MNKITLKVLGVAVAAIFIFRAGITNATTYSADPGATYNPASRSLNRTLADNAWTLCQSFTPSRTPLANHIDILAYGNADASEYSLSLYVAELDHLFDQPPGMFVTENLDSSMFRASTMGAMTGGPDSLAMTRFTNISGSPVDVTPGDKYWICMSAVNFEASQDKVMSWYGASNGTYSGGNAADFTGAPLASDDFGFIVYSAVPPDEPVQSVDETPNNPSTSSVGAPTSTTPTTSTSTSASPTNVKTTVVSNATVVEESVLARPNNFVIDRDLGSEIIFSWDKNTEADLAGYVFSIYDGDTELESLVLEGADVDNYSLILKDHPILEPEKNYTVKLRAQNAAGAVSEPTEGIEISFDKEIEAVDAQEAETVAEPTFWENYMYYIIAIAALIVIGAGVGVYFIYRKRRMQMP